MVPACTLVFVFLLVGSTVNCQSDGISNGEVAKPGQFPYQAQLNFFGFDNREHYKCGGALISEQWVLTAAHCLTDHLTVNLGSITLQINGSGVPVIGIYPHPRFAIDFSDISLIKLGHPVKYNDNIQPVALPDDTDLSSEDFVGKSATVSGFGYTHKNDSSVSDVLLHVNVTVISNADCVKVHPGEDMKIFEHTLCTGPSKNNQNACHGDSGSPLVANVNGKSVLIGIVSRGKGSCGNITKPVAYARVSYFLDWIKETMTKN